MVGQWGEEIIDMYICTKSVQFAPEQEKSIINGSQSSDVKSKGDEKSAQTQGLMRVRDCPRGANPLLSSMPSRDP